MLWHVCICQCFTGYLCGECRGDKGFSVLLNKCVSCGYVNTLLIAALGCWNVIIGYMHVYNA